MAQSSSKNTEVSIHKIGEAFEVYHWSQARDAGVSMGVFQTHAEAHGFALKSGVNLGVPVFDEVAQ